MFRAPLTFRGMGCLVLAGRAGSGKRILLSLFILSLQIFVLLLREARVKWTR